MYISYCFCKLGLISRGGASLLVSFCTPFIGYTLGQTQQQPGLLQLRRYIAGRLCGLRLAVLLWAGSRLSVCRARRSQEVPGVLRINLLPHESGVTGEAGLNASNNNSRVSLSQLDMLLVSKVPCFTWVQYGGPIWFIWPWPCSSWALPTSLTQ